MRSLRAIALPLLSTALACGPTEGPAIDPVADVSAPVGVELVVALHATTPKGDGRVTFDFAAPDLPDLRTRMLPATITTYARGEGALRWTPLATDLTLGDDGQPTAVPHEIDVVAHGDGADAHATFHVTVVPAADDAPVFREPAGEGTTLDLARGPCAEVQVVADDADQAVIDLSLAAPLVDNATLDPVDARTGTLRFCPTEAQLATSTIFLLTLAASDGAHVVHKPYTIVVRPIAVGCTTAPPTITAAPHGDSMATGTLTIVASVADDVAVASVRTLWTTRAPLDPMHPDLAQFTVATMKRTTGDATSGKYQAVLPSPVAGMPSGTVARIYYVVDATDADPPAGCSHESFAPATGVFSFQDKHP